MTASEERLFCASSVTFLPQKTAGILNYAQRQRATQKTNDAYASPSRTSESVIGSLTLARQFENEDSQSLKRPDNCVQLETVVPLSP